MSLKLYCDLMSQPSRALYILLKSIKCNFNAKFVDLRAAEHYSEEFTAINRLQKVPVIDHNGFILTESVAILKYLSRENIIPESLYPRESKAQARVEEFLEWQHAGLRLHCAMYFRVKSDDDLDQIISKYGDSLDGLTQSFTSPIKSLPASPSISSRSSVSSHANFYLNPVMFGKPADPNSVAGYESRMEAALTEFNTKWLGRGTEFITGNTPTVADLLAACELEQPRMSGYDPSENFKNIEVWWKKVREHFNPSYDEGHIIVNKIIMKNSKVSSKV